MGEDKGGVRVEGFSETTIKDMWTKPWGRGWKQRGRWGWLGWGEVMGGKCRQLYFNNTKIIIKKQKI